LGVGVSASGAMPVFVPHSRQNFAFGGNSVPQLEQERAIAVPHSRQNFAPSGFSCLHCVQITNQAPD
jgi:hypothetical protein